MKKFPLLILVLILISTIKLNPVLAQTVTPTAVPTAVPTSITSTPTPTPTPIVLPVPQGISAVMISDDRIDVSWKSSTGASAYEVYRNEGLVAIVSSLFYSDNGLDAETSYSYKVRAYDGTNYSQYSTNVSATTRATSAQGTPEPTIPLGPEDNKLMPGVEETHSYVTIGSVRYAYNEITAFDSGEEFLILGRTEEYADVEIVVMSEPTSYYTKADDDGFWEVSVDTEILEEGDHSFKIVISTPDFSEKYESEEYTFAINPKTEPTIVPANESNFGSSLNRIILIVIALVVLLFIVLVILALKKGWFKKLKSGSEQKDVISPQENMGLNNLIQIDHEGDGTATDPVAPQETLDNNSISTSTGSEAKIADVADEMQPQASEPTPPIDTVSTIDTTIPTTPVENPIEQAEASEEIEVQDNPLGLESSSVSQESELGTTDEAGRVENSEETGVTEMTISTEDEPREGLDIENVFPVPTDYDVNRPDVADDRPLRSIEDQGLEENPLGITELKEEVAPGETQEEDSPINNEEDSSFSSPKDEETEINIGKSTIENNADLENDYSSTTPMQEGESEEIEKDNDDEMVTRDGLYTGLQESVPTIVPEEMSVDEVEQESIEKPNDGSAI